MDELLEAIEYYHAIITYRRAHGGTLPGSWRTKRLRKKRRSRVLGWWTQHCEHIVPGPFYDWSTDDHARPRKNVIDVTDVIRLDQLVDPERVPVFRDTLGSRAAAPTL